MTALTMTVLMETFRSTDEAVRQTIKGKEERGTKKGGYLLWLMLHAILHRILLGGPLRSEERVASFQSSRENDSTCRRSNDLSCPTR